MAKILEEQSSKYQELMTFGNNYTRSTSTPKKVNKIREKENLWENFWRDYSWKFLQHGTGSSQSSPRVAKNPTQDKPKEKHAKTYTNQTKIKHK